MQALTCFLLFCTEDMHDEGGFTFHMQRQQETVCVCLRAELPMILLFFFFSHSFNHISKMLY